jgi:hypothetical protein
VWAIFLFLSILPITFLALEQRRQRFNMATHSPDTSMLEDEKPGANASDGVRTDTEKGVAAARKHKHHDPNWMGDDVDFSGVNEAKVLRKMDMRLIPVLAILYLLSFLDRGECVIRGWIVNINVVL